MYPKILKIILIIITASLLLIALIYTSRTIIDIGCSKTPIGSIYNLKRNFLGVNCWLWEKSIKFNISE